jgi:hypothetical protein
MLGKTRMAVVTVCAAAVVGLGASSALAGEITGNGTLKEPNGNSFCAFSGQEDLQWYYDNADTMPKPEETKGDPGHSQNWGQIPQSVRDQLTQAGYNPGIACNPQKTNGLPPL